MVSKNETNYYKYQNGMKFMTLQNKTFQSMILYFYVKVGSKDETPENNGISHFLEHMLFKGTRKYPSHIKINGILDSKGIDFNAFTYKNMTAYYFKFIPGEDNLKLVCNIIYEMLFKSLNRKKDLDIERNVVVQEFNEMMDTPDDYVEEIIEDFVFKGHKLGMSIIGTKKSIHNISRQDVVDFYNKYYVPKNILISMTGNFPLKYKELVEKYFVKSKSISNIYNPCSNIRTITLPIKEHKLRYEPRKLKQTFLSIVFPSQGLFDKNNNFYRIIANILGGNMSSRLFVKVREEMGLAYSISAAISNYEEAGYFIIDTKTEPEKTTQAFKAIINELKLLKKKGLPKKELDSNKKNYIDIFKTSFDDLEKLAEYYTEQYLFQSQLETVESRIKDMEKISVNDIQQIINNLFDFNKMMVICYGKCEEKKINSIITSLD
jgi:predicted Zn-dependent peptidase